LFSRFFLNDDDEVNNEQRENAVAGIKCSAVEKYVVLWIQQQPANKLSAIIIILHHR
jgi:hypothetical protein